VRALTGNDEPEPAPAPVYDPMTVVHDVLELKLPARVKYAVPEVPEPSSLADKPPHRDAAAPATATATDTAALPPLVAAAAPPVSMDTEEGLFDDV
jgi:hypothetical protein